MEERRGFEGGRERVGFDYNAPSRADSVKGCVQWYFVHLLISVLSHQCTPCVFSTSCLYVHVRLEFHDMDLIVVTPCLVIPEIRGSSHSPIRVIVNSRQTDRQTDRHPFF